jgi:hypothetical protein
MTVVRGRAEDRFAVAEAEEEMISSATTSTAAASAVATRMRLVQTSLADETPEKRRDYLRDELTRALQDMSGEERQAFLAALRTRFPLWSSASPPPPPPPPPQAEASPRPPPLLEQLQRLSADERAALLARLPGGAVPEPLGGAEELAKVLGAANVNSERIVPLTLLLIDVIVRVEQFVWDVWSSQIAPSSKIQRQKELRDEMAAFLADEGVSREQLEQQLKRLRHLIVTLLPSISPATQQFAHRYVTRFLPDEIEALAKIEGKRAWESWELRYWRKYRELAASLSEKGIEKEIIGAIAQYAEKMMPKRDVSE